MLFWLINNTDSLPLDPGVVRRPRIVPALPRLLSLRLRTRGLFGGMGLAFGPCPTPFLAGDVPLEPGGVLNGLCGRITIIADARTYTRANFPRTFPQQTNQINIIHPQREM